MSKQLPTPQDWWSRLVELGRYQVPVPPLLDWPSRWRQRRTVARASEQRSLLRWMRVAADQQLPLVTLVEAWSSAERRLQCLRLREFTEQLRSGMSVPDALEAVPGLLSAERLLAVRCGVQTGTLPQTLEQLLAGFDEAHDSDGEVTGNRQFWVYTLGEVAVIGSIFAFLVIKLFPAMIQVGQEMGLSHDPLAALQRDVREVMKWYWAWFVVSVVLLFWAYSSGLLARWWVRLGRRRESWLGRWQDWLGGSQRDVLRQIRPSVGAGRPLPAVISTLARYSTQPAIRHDLLFARNEVELGTPAWQALQAVGQVTAVEAKLLSEAARPQDRAWILHRLVQQHAWQMRHNRRRFWTLARPLAVILLSLFVFQVAWAVISNLSGYIQATLGAT